MGSAALLFPTPHTLKTRATLERIGKLLANMDLLIAAHAAAVGAVLVTNDHTLRECAKHIDVRHTVNWANDVVVKPWLPIG